MVQPMRVAWFSPLPPDASGIAAYSAEVVPLLMPRFGALDLYSAPLSGRTSLTCDRPGRVHLAPPAPALRPRRLPARQLEGPRFHVELPVPISRPAGAARRASASGPRALAAQPAGAEADGLSDGSPRQPSRRVTGPGPPVRGWTGRRAVPPVAARLAGHRRLSIDGGAQRSSRPLPGHRASRRRDHRDRDGHGGSAARPADAGDRRGGYPSAV